jgi:hypothetical protein
MNDQLLLGILIGLAMRDVWPRMLRPLRLQLRGAHAKDDDAPSRQLRP